MKKCIKCSQQLPDDCEVCTYCGERQERITIEIENESGKIDNGKINIDETKKVDKKKRKKILVSVISVVLVVAVLAVTFICKVAVSSTPFTVPLGIITKSKVIKTVYDEAIIDRDVFMKVKAEIARRANLNPDGKRRVYSSKYALSGMVFCGHCGDIYRRVKWNNRGCKSTVWRCVSRVLKGKMDFDCPARTVKEEVLQGAIVTAVNDAYARKNIVMALLKQNIESTVFGDLEERLAMADKELADLQAQMIAVSGDDAMVDALGEQIDGLRAERQSILTEAADRSDLQERMNDMISFLDEMPTMLTEYSDAITRRLVEKIMIYDEKIVVELKSGLQMEVEA